MSVKKRYLTGDAAREALLAGAKTLYDLVAITSGPKGLNVAYSRPWGLPRIINDGIEIAKEVGTEDDFYNIGIDLVREAAQNTVTDAGDGTTTSVILAYHILKEGVEMIKGGENGQDIRTQVLEALTYLLAEIPTLSQKVETQEQLKEVALISASGDEEIAEHASKAIYKMGKDGLVTAEEGYGTAITSEMTKGMQIQKGYLDPFFKTDESRNEAVILDPAIVVSERILSGQGEAAAILGEIAKSGKKDVVIFGDVRGEALRTLIINKLKGTMNVLAVNPPFYQEQRLAFLEDIAVLTGAKIITSGAQEFLASQAGGASHVSANKTTTNIVGGKGAETMLKERIDMIKGKREEDASLYEKEKLDERLAKLSGGAALIKVGAKSETLKREKFEKTKDAIGASKAALNEGTVAGGGMAFISLAHRLKEKYPSLNAGQTILYKALLAPTRKLMENSGKDEGSLTGWMNDILKAPANHGYNVNSDKIENLRECGVVDATRVIRLSLENAAVIATSILTSGAVITDVPPEPGTQQQI